MFQRILFLFHCFAPFVSLHWAILYAYFDPMLPILLIFVASVYVVQMLWLRIGLNRADIGSTDPHYQPNVSIIVAARNEEEFIGACLSSLVKLRYPANKLEIIIVNDGSTDNTASIAAAISAAHPNVSLHNSIAGKDNLRGKTNAVAQGIAFSHGEILMFTDADCVVPENWVASTVKQFGEGVGIVGGFTLLDAHSVFEGTQGLDWLFLFSLSSSMAGWRMPITVIGNNLSVRRSAYDATGGFSKIPFSVTEDYALVQAVLNRTDYSILFPQEKETLVISKPCKTMWQLYRQKQRWGVGGLDMVFRGFFLTGVGWLLRLLLVILSITAPSVMVLAALSSMLLSDLFFLWRSLKRFGLLLELRYFLAFEGYFSCYVLVLPFVALLSKNVVWKERKL